MNPSVTVRLVIFHHTLSNDNPVSHVNSALRFESSSELRRPEPCQILGQAPDLLVGEHLIHLSGDKIPHVTEWPKGPILESCLETHELKSQHAPAPTGMELLSRGRVFSGARAGRALVVETHASTVQKCLQDCRHSGLKSPRHVKAASLETDGFLHGAA